MKFDPKKILALKPFDESSDNLKDDYSGSKIRTFLILLTFCSAIAALSAVFLFPMGDAPIILMSISCASSAILSGIEWHLGFKAKALNKLFEVFMLLILLVLIKQLTW